MIVTVIKIYIVFAVVMFFSITFISSDGDIFSFAITPREICETSELNILGSILLSILLFIFDPLLFVFRFMHFVFHVKRD